MIYGISWHFIRKLKLCFTNFFFLLLIVGMIPAAVDTYNVDIYYSSQQQKKNYSNLLLHHESNFDYVAYVFAIAVCQPSHIVINIID